MKCTLLAGVTDRVVTAQRFVKHAVDWRVREVRFVPLATNGCEDFRLFSFEVN